jgi:hypothetical protein
MGEAKQQSLNRAAILAKDPFCIYCGSKSTTVEHMPPKAMFKYKHRSSGLEFGCCVACNNGTRTSDAIACFIAHTPSDRPQDEWKIERSLQLYDTIKQQEPNFRSEFWREQKHKKIFVKQPSGLLTPAVKVRLDGPIVNRHLDVFSAKLGMAIFREHVGSPMTKGSGVYVSWFGTPDNRRAENANRLIDRLPHTGELKQGRKQSKDQFVYRYRSDDTSFVAAIIGFHSNLHILTLAVADIAAQPMSATSVDGRTLVKYGELLKHGQ